MSDRPTSYTRRSVAIGGGIAVALGLAAIGVNAPRWLGRHYRASRYDDLLSRLVDRDAAVKVGKAALLKIDAMSGIPEARKQYLERTIPELRRRLNRRTLTEAARSDVAEGALAEAAGWVLPESVLMLCVVAATETAEA